MTTGLFAIFNESHMAIVFAVLCATHVLRVRYAYANGRYKIAQTWARVIISGALVCLWIMWALHDRAGMLPALTVLQFRIMLRIGVWLFVLNEIAYYLDVWLQWLSELRERIG